MMPFKQVLTTEPLKQDELPQSTNAYYAPHAGDKYSQLEDSTTTAVLDGTVRALAGVDTIVLMDLVPKHGAWARYFVRLLPRFEICCAFGVADDILWTQRCIRVITQDLYLDGSLKLAGFDPLPSDMDRGP